MVKPEEVADATVNLANPGLASTTGIALHVDVGESARCSSGHSHRPKSEVKEHRAKNRFGYRGQSRWSEGLRAAPRRRVAHSACLTMNEKGHELIPLSALRDAVLLHGIRGGRSRVRRNIRRCRSGHVGVVGRVYEAAAADDRSSARRVVERESRDVSPRLTGFCNILPNVNEGSTCHRLPLSDCELSSRLRCLECTVE